MPHNNGGPLQLYRGTTEQNDSYTGAEGELTFDVMTKRLRTHDGMKVGGYEIALSSEVVHNMGDELIGGAKTFADSPLVPTAPAGDSSQRAASTGFVTQTIQALDGDVVHRSGDEIVDGKKEFIISPVAPTPSLNDSSQKVATTEFVQGVATQVDGGAVHVYGNERVDGVKTFTSSPIVPTLSAGDSSQAAASTAFVDNAIRTGTANAATRLDPGRTIGISGAVTGTPTLFDGTKNIVIPTTALDMSKATEGVLPVARGGTGVTTIADIKAGKDANGDTIHTTYAKLNSPALVGVPTAPTAPAATNTTQLATTAFVESEIDRKLTAAQALRYKGTIGAAGSGATVTALPTTHEAGWVYVVKTAGTYAGQVCDVGDYIICKTTGTSSSASHWDVVEKNVVRAVTSPSAATSGHVAIYDGNSGLAIKDSGFTIGVSVPANAKFTDTTYSAGTGLQLSGTTFSIQATAVTAGNYGPTADATPGYGQTFTVPYFTVDAQGRITGAATRTIKIPASDNTDTHWTTKLIVTTSTGTVNAATSNGATYFRLFDNSTARATLKIAGTGATTVSSDANGNITISSTDTDTKPVAMKGATASAAGTAGYVPAPPTAGYNTKYLRADGTWQVPPDTNTTYTAGTGITISSNKISVALTSAMVTTALGYTPPKTAAASVGSASLPVYVNNGTITACSTSLGVSITGNAATATSASKLITARSINGTSFNGSGDITTATWGTARTITISDNSGTNTQANANINGSIDFTLKMPATIKATLNGTADVANKLGTANVGSATLPIYLNAGVPKVCGNSLAVSITGNAATATKIQTAPVGTSYVTAVTAGGSLVNSTATSFGTVFNAPTKSYRVGLGTYPTSNELVYLYSVTNANVSAGTNTINKSLTWNAADGTLTATKLVGPLTGNVTGNADTATTASKLGTANVGSATLPIYLNAGVPKACGNSLAVSITGNAATATTATSATTATTASKLGTADIGSSTLPIYLDNGVPKVCGNSLAVSITGNAATATTATTATTASKLGTANVGSTTQPIYLKAGVATASNANVGDANIPVYMKAGVITSTGKSFANYLPLAGGTVTGPLILSTTTDAAPGADNAVALRIGNINGVHLAIDGNEIIAKTSPTEVGTLSFADSAAVAVPTVAESSNNTYAASTAWVRRYVTSYINPSSYLPLAGGTMNAGAAVYFNTTNATAHKCSIHNNSSGSFGMYDHTNGKWIIVEDSAGNVTVNGNATTASTLKTARTIWGNSFDGSGNITGDITVLNNDPYIHLQHNQLTKGTDPSGNEWGAIYFEDKDGNDYARLRFQVNSAGRSYMDMYVVDSTKDSTTAASLGIAYNKGSGAYTFAPTPAANDDSTKIATTAWIRSYVAPSNKAVTLAWNTTSTLATVGGVNITAKLPASPVTAANVKSALGTGTGTTKYLREDGTWHVPPDTNTTYSVFGKSGSDASTGLVPKPSTTAGTTKYLREDATWQAIPNATTTAAGLMTAADKTKLNGLSDVTVASYSSSSSTNNITKGSMLVGGLFVAWGTWATSTTGTASVTVTPPSGHTISDLMAVAFDRGNVYADCATRTSTPSKSGTVWAFTVTTLTITADGSKSAKWPNAGGGWIAIGRAS